MTQINDVMYLDQYTVISFEYHCYMTDVRYEKLVRKEHHIGEDGIMRDSQGIPVNNLL